MTSASADPNETAGQSVGKWLPYHAGDYEKKFYDIKTLAGHTYYGCWPNAGAFRISDSETVDEHFVVKFRVSKLNDLGMPARAQGKE